MGLNRKNNLFSEFTQHNNLINNMNPKNSQRSFSALILASGLSERMGQPKALLMWDNKKTFLEKIVQEYIASGCEKIICTLNNHVLPHCRSNENFQGVKFVLNPHPDWGRMYSVMLGLKEIGQSQFCLIQNVDNPFIHSEMIKKIVASGDHQSWCSPEFGGKGGHPVLLPKIVINKILSGNCLEITFQQILKQFPKKTVECEDDSILRNINTPEDYRNYLFRKEN